jgi:hypothetical protein
VEKLTGTGLNRNKGDFCMNAFFCIELVAVHPSVPEDTG